MSSENTSDKPCKDKSHRTAAGASNTVYGMGVIGALIYFFTHASGFGAILWGIVQSLFWPAFLVYKALELLKM